jgi:FkbM family methyltransferase
MNYGDDNHATNGEVALLDRVASHLGPSPVIFDVGANVGRYAVEMTKRIPGAQLHAFEPSASAFTRLKIALGDRGRAHKLAFAAEDGERPLFGDTPGSELSSLVRRDLHRFAVHVREIENVRVRRIDTFCREHGIGRIDWLKVDAEGADLDVLRGAGDMLGSRIGAIQFEFGGTGIDAHTSLRDFFDLLEGDYRLHRLLPAGLRPLEYSERLEVFVYANYVAFPK